MGVCFSQCATVTVYVRLNVYKLAQDGGWGEFVSALSENVGIGHPNHSGVELWWKGGPAEGIELAFGPVAVAGADPDAATTTAVWYHAARAPPAAFIQATGAKLSETIEMGTVELSPLQLEHEIATLRRRWDGTPYSLAARNCNHFSDAACLQLVGRRIPEHVNKLAGSAQGAQGILKNIASGLGHLVAAADAALNATPPPAVVGVDQRRRAKPPLTVVA